MKEQKLVKARCIDKNWRQECKGKLVSRAVRFEEMNPANCPSG